MKTVETENEGLKRGYTLTIPAKDIDARMDSEVKRMYADLGYRTSQSEFHLSFTGAKNGPKDLCSPEISTTGVGVGSGDPIRPSPRTP